MRVGTWARVWSIAVWLALPACGPQGSTPSETSEGAAGPSVSVAWRDDVTWPLAFSQNDLYTGRTVHLHPDGTVTEAFAGCTSSGEWTGRWREEADGVFAFFSEDGEHEGRRYWVSWGDRVHLVDDFQADTFFESLERERELDLHGTSWLTLLGEDEPMSPPKGDPVFPEAARGVVDERWLAGVADDPWRGPGSR